MRRAQLSFGDGLIAEEVSDLREDWMKHADKVLDDEQIVAAVYEALAKRHPKSRSRGRPGAPAEMVLRLLILKHIRNWSYGVLEREVRANLVYRDFARVGGAKMPDAKTMGRWGLAVEPAAMRLETLLTPKQWAALVRLNVRLGTDTVEPIPGYGDLETLGYGKNNVVMRKAAVTTPLGLMPLAVLAHARPFDLPEEAEGLSSDALESVLRAANENLATLAPNARFFIAKDSGHDIQQDQPKLVIEAIRQVVAGVRDPDTWYDLTSCCAR